MFKRCVEVFAASVMCTMTYAAPLPTNLPTTADDHQAEWSEAAQPIDQTKIPLAALEMFAQVYERVRQNYVEPVTDTQLFDNAMHGLLSELDPYSAFLDAKSYDSILELTDGEIARTGVVLKLYQDQWKIEQIDPDSPAVRLGLKVGDVVTRIEGKSLKTLGQQDIDQLMSGPVGSSVRLNVSSSGARPKEFRVLRRIPEVRPAQISMSFDGIATLKIHAFQTQTGAQIMAVLDPLQQHQQLKGLVIDLRDNPGGLLVSAVEVSNLFLDQGLIVSTRGRGEPEQRYQALSAQRYPNLPIAILLNRYSASAAEVVAGALQDHKRALIVGQNSYGKGSVQKLWPLGEGRAMKLTVARYYTPNGRMIEGKGIVPDVLLPVAEIKAEHDVNLQQTIDVVRRQIMTNQLKVATEPSTPQLNPQKTSIPAPAMQNSALGSVP